MGGLRNGWVGGFDTYKGGGWLSQAEVMPRYRRGGVCEKATDIETSVVL